MNTKKILGIVLVVAVVAFVVWRFAQPKSEAVIPNDDTSVTTTIPGATKNADGDFSYKNESEFLSVEAEYPSTTKLAAAPSAKARVTMETWVIERTTDFTKMVNEELLDAAEMARLRENGRKYAMGIDYKQYSSPTTVSFVYQSYEDTGGAHPNVYYTTFTFDKSGNELELADLFTPGARYLDRLSTESYKLVVAELTKRSGGAVLDESQLDWIRMGTAPSPEAIQFFYVSGSDLVLIFPPYQVASYAAGMFEIRMPLASFSDILK